MDLNFTPRLDWNDDPTNRAPDGADDPTNGPPNPGSDTQNDDADDVNRIDVFDEGRSGPGND